MFGFGNNNKAQDPICGMRVDKNKTQFSYEKNGEKNYFCSQNCKDTFIKDEKSDKKTRKSCC